MVMNVMSTTRRRRGGRIELARREEDMDGESWWWLVVVLVEVSVEVSVIKKVLSSDFRIKFLREFEIARGIEKKTGFKAVISKMAIFIFIGGD
jgi:hypothetical protein